MYCFHLLTHLHLSQDHFGYFFLKSLNGMKNHDSGLEEQTVVEFPVMVERRSPLHANERLLFATILHLEKTLVGDVRLRLWVYQVSPNHQILNALSWLNVDQRLGG